MESCKKRDISPHNLCLLSLEVDLNRKANYFELTGCTVSHSLEVQNDKIPVSQARSLSSSAFPSLEGPTHSGLLQLLPLPLCMLSQRSAWRAVNAYLQERTEINLIEPKEESIRGSPGQPPRSVEVRAPISKASSLFSKCRLSTALSYFSFTLKSRGIGVSGHHALKKLPKPVVWHRDIREPPLDVAGPSRGMPRSTPRQEP